MGPPMRSDSVRSRPAERKNAAVAEALRSLLRRPEASVGHLTHPWVARCGHRAAERSRRPPCEPLRRRLRPPRRAARRRAHAYWRSCTYPYVRLWAAHYVHVCLMAGLCVECLREKEKTREGQASVECVLRSADAVPTTQSDACSWRSAMPGLGRPAGQPASKKEAPWPRTSSCW